MKNARDKSQAGSPANRRKWLRRIAIGAAVAFPLFGLAIAWPHLPKERIIYTDAESIQQEESYARIRSILWTPPTRLPSLVSSEHDDYEPRVTHDGQGMFFVRGRTGENADIYFCPKTGTEWGTPVPIPEINSDYDELGPSPTKDGTALYFYSDRPGGQGGYDIWVAYKRVDGMAGFSEPVNLGPAVNSPHSDYGPVLLPDASTLVFSSNRPLPHEQHDVPTDPWSATIRESRSDHHYDLYRVAISATGFDRAEVIDSLNTTADEGSPAISPVGDFLYFASNRSGGQGGFDLYRSRIVAGVFQDPDALDVSVNGPYNELDPALDMGGFGLYFSSDRETRTDAQNRSVYDLFHTTSREVFAQLDIYQSRFDWAAFWDAVGPSLLLALLTLLLILALLYMLWGLQSRQLSLLARCLLASLLAHLLLLLALSLYHVTAGVAGALQEKGGTHITLAPRTGNDITAQIRGANSELPAPVPAPGEIKRVTTEIPELESINLKAIRHDLAGARLVRASSVSAMTPRQRTEPLLPLPDHAAPVGDALHPDSLPIELPRQQKNAAINEPSVVPETDAFVSPIAKQEIPAAVVRGKIPTPDLTTAVNAASLTDLVTQSTARIEALNSDRSVSALPSMELPIPEPMTQAEHSSALVTKDLPERAKAAVDLRDDPELDAAVPSTSTMDRQDLLDTFAPPSDTLAESLQPVLTIDAATPERSSMARDLPAGDLAQSAPDATLHDSRIPVPTHDAPVHNLSTAFAESTSRVRQHQEGDHIEVDIDWKEKAGTRTANSDAARVDTIRELTAPAKWDVPRVKTLDAAGVPRASRAQNAFGDTPAALPEDMPELAADSLKMNVPIDIELSLPPAARPSEAFAHRDHENRENVLRERGGSKQTENAVKAALKWLAAHQSRDGRWDGDGFDKGCGQCGDETDSEVDVGITGLALLAFLAADHTHLDAGTYRKNVENGLAFLLRNQQRDGDLRAGETMYSHAIATIAIAEAYGMTGDESLRAPVESAVAFINEARNKRIGGWRYDPGQAGDTSVLGWQIMALKAASASGIDIPYQSLETAHRWIERVASGTHGGLYAYKPSQDPTPSMTAEALFVQQLLGTHPHDPRNLASVALIMRNPPRWDDDAPTYYWYYATLALFQHGGEPWVAWNKAVSTELLEHQRRDERAAGSWDPVDRWSRVGGRVYQTAIAALTLEVYYRYLPSFVEPMPADSIGTIAGTVTNADNGRPLAGATVTLDVPDRDPITATAGPDGAYRLFAPPLPKFFALSASNEAFLPVSRNVAKRKVVNRTHRVDFELQPESIASVALELEPRVHHLGDDAFDGVINSRFQRSAEGDTFTTPFKLTERHLHDDVRLAHITMMVKGVQLKHRLFVNRHRLKKLLQDSPQDGRFGEFSISVPVDYLVTGENEFEIRASRRGTDVDDFEFVNVQIHLESSE